MPKLEIVDGQRNLIVYLTDVVIGCPTHYWVYYDGRQYIIPFKLPIASVAQLRVLSAILGLQKGSKAQMLENLHGRITFEAF